MKLAATELNDAGYRYTHDEGRIAVRWPVKRLRLRH